MASADDDWAAATDERGDLYYYHTTTGQASFDWWWVRVCTIIMCVLCEYKTDACAQLFHTIRAYLSV